MNSTNLQDVEKICASMLAPLKKTYDLKHSIQSELSPQEIDEHLEEKSIARKQLFNDNVNISTDQYDHFYSIMLEESKKNIKNIIYSLSELAEKTS